MVPYKYKLQCFTLSVSACLREKEDIVLSQTADKQNGNLHYYFLYCIMIFLILRKYLDQ